VDPVPYPDLTSAEGGVLLRLMLGRLTRGAGGFEFLVDELASSVFHGIDELDGRVLEAVSILVEFSSLEGRSRRGAAFAFVA